MSNDQEPNLPTWDELLERDKDIITDLKQVRRENKVEPEWILLAEFGIFFGWSAVQDVRNDVISFDEMNKLLAAARKMEAVKRYNEVIDMYSAVMAQHKGGDKVLKQTLRGIKSILNE